MHEETGLGSGEGASLVSPVGSTLESAEVSTGVEELSLLSQPHIPPKTRRAKNIIGLGRLLMNTLSGHHGGHERVYRGSVPWTKRHSGQSQEENMEAFKNRLRKNQRHFGKWARRRGIGAYRIYDHDIPEVPAIVERVGNAAVVWLVPRFTDDEMLGVPIEQAVMEVLELSSNDLFVKRRTRQEGGDQYNRITEKSVNRVVEEGNLKFHVNLSDYLDTGLFLDQRNHRQRIGEMSEGKSILNLFAYTGSFSVYGAAGGAASTTTVDLSNTYLQWAERNFEINGLRGPEHRFVRNDVFEYLREAWAEDHRFDIIICDPPTFSNSKRMTGTLDIQRDHTGLLNLALRLLRKEGHLFFSTNRRKFQLDEEALEVEVIEEWTPRTIPEDFRDKKVHRAWWMGRE